MKVRVRFFGGPREALGSCEIERDLPSGSTVQDLLDALLEEYPVLQSYSTMIKTAVNRKYAGRETRLREGDEVAVLPPVAGG
jgi:molybdopterin synthase catalytic subunit